jgi:hypothetical protein
VRDLHSLLLAGLPGAPKFKNFERREHLNYAIIPTS